MKPAFMRNEAAAPGPREVPVPPAPGSIEATGLEPAFLVALLAKIIYRHGLEKTSDIASVMKLPVKVAADLVQIATDQKLIETLGQRGALVTAEMRYQLTGKGREWALEALSQSEYAGAAPVPVEQFARQAAAQSIRGERLLRPTLEAVFAKLTLSPHLMRQLGPAANSGASMLLYGPPGNGKSSIAEALCRAFGSCVWLPRALEIDRQVITLYDPAVHSALTGPEGGAEETGLRRTTSVDRRYVPCRRPRIIAGGELTLDMMDLSYSPVSRIYEAPMQLKAVGGVLVVDDFGRQRQHPQELVNRLIIPLENGVDFLALRTGRKFEAPFDSLVVFSTNIPPSELVDEAALRRLRYKINVDSPDRETFVRIFLTTAERMGLAVSDDLLAHVLVDLYAAQNRRFQAFHPRFLFDQAIAICAYEGIEPVLTPEVIGRAWENLFPAD